MTPEELDEILHVLREVGGDIANVEVKRAEGGLPKRLWETLSAFANTPGGGTLILGLDEETGFRVVDVRDPARLQSDLASLCDFAAYDLNDAQRLALAYLRREGRLTNADYRRLNPGLDSAEVTRQLADLVRRGLLDQHGTRRWTRYTLAGQAASAATPNGVAVSENLAPLPVDQSSQSVEPIGESVEQLDRSIDLEDEPREQLSISIKLARVAPLREVRKAILSLCGIAPQTSQQLADLLGRNRVYLLHRYLSPLVAEQLLARLGRATTDPHVTYRTTEAGRAWLSEVEARP